ncbi:MAG: hypothetical protein WA211_07440 [Candidatus Acidiferrales bacterium]
MAFLPWILVSISFFVAKPAGPAVAHARPVPSMDTKQQRVWTNDDIPTLREIAPISDLRPGSGAPASVAATGGGAAAAPVQTYIKELDPHWYADQRETLQARIDADEDLIRHILEIRIAGDGITDAIPLDKDDPGLTPEATVEILQNEVAQLRAQIDELQDMARQNGIPAAVVR